MIFEGQAGHRGHPREAHVLSLSLLTRVARIASVANNLVCCMDENRKLQVLKHHGIALATLCQVQFAHKRGKNETSARASTALPLNSGTLDAFHYVYTVIVFCEVNMSCFQNVASIFVLEDRCRKGFRNVSGTLTVILKFC